MLWPGAVARDVGSISDCKAIAVLRMGRKVLLWETPSFSETPRQMEKPTVTEVVRDKLRVEPRALGVAHEEPRCCAGRSVETNGRWSSNGLVIHGREQWIVIDFCAAPEPVRAFLSMCFVVFFLSVRKTSGCDGRHCTCITRWDEQLETRFPLLVCSGSVSVFSDECTQGSFRCYFFGPSYPFFFFSYRAGCSYF